MHSLKVAIVLLVAVVIGIAVWDDARTPKVDSASVESEPAVMDAPVVGPPTGPGDPYAAGQQVVKQNTYESLKAEAMEQTTTAAWAYKCRVISDMDLFNLSQMYARAMLAPTGGVNMTDPHLNDDIAAAEKVGVSFGTSKGCAYWQDDPQIVASIRSEAQLAAP